MATTFDALKGLNQGQEIALGWDNPAGFKRFTALIGTDGKHFLPVDDRGGYLQGVIQQLTTGGIYYTGMPTVTITHSWISDGQIETLKTYRGNCTLKHHIDDSAGKTDLQISNVIFNLDLNQLASLERDAFGYRDFRSTFTIVEVLS